MVGGALGVEVVRGEDALGKARVGPGRTSINVQNQIFFFFLSDMIFRSGMLKLAVFLLNQKMWKAAICITTKVHFHRWCLFCLISPFLRTVWVCTTALIDIIFFFSHTMLCPTAT